MNFIISVLKGAAIGAGAILPGISSGVLCVIFGLYEDLINSLLDLFKDFKKNFLFLLPIGIGGIIGFVLFGNILKYLFSTYTKATKFVFLLLILISIPSLFKQANSKNKFCLHYLLFTIICFGFSLFLIRLENVLPVINNLSYNISFLYLTFCGFCMSAGIIVPGVSSTVILMCLGIYDIYLSAVSIINLNILIPMFLGVIIGSFIFINLVKFLLNKYYTQTFYSIIGFVLASILILI